MTTPNNNMRIWDDLGVTDPSHTKGFKRAGGFSGTAIKPMWSFKRMTEKFGPAGMGWGPTEPHFQVVQADTEVMVYCTVGLWFRDTDSSSSETVYGVGGDKVMSKGKDGLRSSDEAFKAAYTDALSNAMKLIGVGADVHMGRFDDSKYLKEAAEEFDEEGNRISPEAKADRPKVISKTQRDLFVSTVKEKNIPREAVVEFLKTLGFESSGEITADRYHECTEWVKNYAG